MSPAQTRVDMNRDCNRYRDKGPPTGRRGTGVVLRSSHMLSAPHKQLITVRNSLHLAKVQLSQAIISPSAPWSEQSFHKLRRSNTSRASLDVVSLSQLST
jgi:hypothetical protein